MLIQAFSFLISVFISCLTEVQGLKCYICDNGMDGCVVDVNLKSEYLKDCHSRAIGCAVFQCQTINYTKWRAPDNTKEIWIQRTCLYPRDLECFALERSDLPGEEGEWHEDYGFVDQIGYANTFRTQDGLPLMKAPPVSALIRKRTDPFPPYQVQTCESLDGCNYWDKDSGTMFPFAKGFPIPEHNAKKSGGKISCYSCNNFDNPYCIVKQTSSDKKSSHGEAYGCAMLSIYKIGAGLQNKSSYFERDVWYPGDHWCLEHALEEGYSRSGGPSESPVMHVKPRNDEDEVPCDDDEYERARKERNTDNEYHWTGIKRFFNVEGFSAFLKCRQQVKIKLGISGVGFDLDSKFDRRVAIRTFADMGGYYYYYNTFAWVGFRFCGTQDLCNDWSDHQLYQEVTSNLQKPPTTTTDPTVTTTTPPPTTSPKRGGGGNGGGLGDGCVKKEIKNIAMRQVTPLPAGILLLALLSPMTIDHLII